ncbi:MAG TPA: acyl-CoA dehydrogenase family protein [Actinomycetales bacterium]|nr:acyl-CoA dehydrogenase family protein [Actinomycetales bacterium]
MDFAPDPTTTDLASRLEDFMASHVLPAEPVLVEQVAAARADGDPWGRPPVVSELKTEARSRGLWNLFLPHPDLGAGLTNLQYAPLAEITGRSPSLAPEALNCSAPDTGNMEVLVEFGTPEQQDRWLKPLLDGQIRSAFCMTEPDVASSDATNITTAIRRDGDSYVVSGRKWWSTGAMDPRAEIFIVMGRSASDDDAPRHERQSMILVPRDAPGVEVVRGLHTFGFDDASHGGHAEVAFHDVRVPASAMIAGEGKGFAIAQARLGPGRIHHCMRLIGMGERALELMCRRALSRVAFGRPIADQGVVGEQIARARVGLEQARLLVLKTAWLMDTVGNRGAHTEIQAIKIAVPRLVQDIVDDAIQVHGGMGVCQDTILPELWVAARTLRLADGPDEVHRMSLARRELKRYR